MSKPKTAKPKIKSARSKYKPPIPWERLQAMQRAVFNYTYHGEKIDRPMATEILHALSHLSGVFQKELLNRPGRPFAKETWWAAAITLSLLENHVANSVGGAVAAAVGVCFPTPGPNGDFLDRVQRTYNKLKHDQTINPYPDFDAKLLFEAVSRLRSPLQKTGNKRG